MTAERKMTLRQENLKKDKARYFRQTDTLRLLGGGLAILGVAWYWLGWSYASYIIPTIVTPIGFVLFIIASSRHVSHKDMEEEIVRGFEGYDTSVTNRKDYDRLVLKHPVSVETRAFYMGQPATYFRQGEGSRLVSDVCIQSHFFFTKDALLVCSRVLSLTDNQEDGRICDREESLPFDHIQNATLTETKVEITLTNTKKKVFAKQYELVIAGDEGEILRLPVHQDMDTENLCQEINRRIKQNP